MGWAAVPWRTSGWDLALEGGRGGTSQQIPCNAQPRASFPRPLCPRKVVDAGAGWSPARPPPHQLHPGLWSPGSLHASPRCHPVGGCQLVSPLSELRVALAPAGLAYRGSGENTRYGQECARQSWGQGPSPAPWRVNRPLLFWALRPRSGFIPFHPGLGQGTPGGGCLQKLTNNHHQGPCGQVPGQALGQG